MAEECVDQALMLARLEDVPCRTSTLPIHGAQPEENPDGPLSVYGSDAGAIEQLIRKEPSLAEPLDPALPIYGAQVVWAVRSEMARTVEDVLARRTRALFLNARAALAIAPAVARLMARELKQDAAWQQKQLETFAHTAEGFMVEA
jgi:glycerol-3-phosphate dehydrogenase